MLELVKAIATRIQDEQYLDDFLRWRGGSLEHWVQIVSTSVARECGWWAADSEIPYHARVPARSKTGEKWADAAAVKNGRICALIEAKTVPKRQGKRLGSAMRDTIFDLASLLTTDWTNTSCEERWANYVDGKWRAQRATVKELWGIGLVILHGEKPLAEDLIDEVADGHRRGVAALKNRLANYADADDLERRISEILQAPTIDVPLEGVQTAGRLLAWCAEVSVVN